ncbi:MAG: hypothetical protein ACJAZ9_001721 [Neolewinella sp.]|jgi:hypothetical protein
MESLAPSLNWGNFVKLAILLGIVHLVLRLLPLVIRAISLSDLAKKWWLKTISMLQVVYEPLALLVLAISLLFINPVLHSIVLGVILMLGWGPIRNFIAGRFLQATTELAIGQEINYRDIQGTIQSLNAFSLNLQTENGTRVVQYHQLQETGFTIQRGARISGFHEFVLHQEGDSPMSQEALSNYLFNCPYLDWSFEPEIKAVDIVQNGFQIRVLIEEESYLNNFKVLIGEWGYVIKEKIAA